jgi:hypothetical protein
VRHSSLGRLLCLAGGFVVPYPNEHERPDGKTLVLCPLSYVGVAPSEFCLLHSGGPRSEPHVDRKLSAAEAMEKKRIPRGPGRQ